MVIGVAVKVAYFVSELEFAVLEPAAAAALDAMIFVVTVAAVVQIAFAEEAEMTVVTVIAEENEKLVKVMSVAKGTVGNVTVGVELMFAVPSD